ncbi:MAG TPA: hypothetical protein VM056_06745 [Terriglobales bacterium]|nr:hypothetical protein [Terriglobales bacterium]
MIRFGLALAMLAGLAALSWYTLPDPKVRAVTLIVLGGCAVKIWIEQKRRWMEEKAGNNGGNAAGAL